jgi:formate dehydrogenase assembly factor FdhD
VPIAIDPHVARAWVERVRGGERERVEDELAIEEPLEIRVDGKALAVTMRTPGEDEELAVGFLAGEGLIASQADISSCGVCGKGALEFVRIEAPPAPESAPFDAALVTRAPERARGRQPVFERTGGLHATALFERGGVEPLSRRRRSPGLPGSLPSAPPRAWPSSWPGSAGYFFAASQRAPRSMSTRVR